MARPKDPKKRKLIIDYLKKKKTATTYALGKVINSDPTLAKSYLNDMIETKKAFKCKIVEKGRVKIFYSLSKDLLPKVESFDKLNTIKKEKCIIPLYYKVIDELFGQIIGSNNRKILYEELKNMGYTIKQIIELQKDANTIEMEN